MMITESNKDKQKVEVIEEFFEDPMMRIWRSFMKTLRIKKMIYDQHC